MPHPHHDMAYLATTTDLNSYNASVCRWCGMIHGLLCPMVKAYRYYPDGKLQEVEFHPSRENGTTILDAALKLARKLNPDDGRKE